MGSGAKQTRSCSLYLGDYFTPLGLSFLICERTTATPAAGGRHEVYQGTLRRAHAPALTQVGGGAHNMLGFRILSGARFPSADTHGVHAGLQCSP